MSGENVNPQENTPNLDPTQFAYYSRRDTDKDGINDVIHTKTHDGQTQIHHLDEHGSITLTEIDTDADGILETTIRELDESRSMTQKDLDGDGFVDQVKVIDTATNTTTQQDTIVDGKVIHSMVDNDSDGLSDVELFDTDDDGKFDTVVIDSDKDGVPNTIYSDTDNDGRLDHALTDSDNNDGILETELTAKDLGTEFFGNISDFTNMLELNGEEANQIPEVESQMGDHDDFSSEL